MILWKEILYAKLDDERLVLHNVDITRANRFIDARVLKNRKEQIGGYKLRGIRCAAVATPSISE